MRYARYILPHITLGAAKKRLDFGWRLSIGPRDPEAYSPNQSVLQWSHHLHLAGAAAHEPGDADLRAIQVEQYPRLIFEEHGQTVEFAVNPEFAVAKENPMGIKSQYELNYFNEMLGLAQNIARQNEQKGSTVLKAS